MIVTYLGHEFIKLQYGDKTVAFNPPSKSSKFKNSKFGADLVLVSLNHEDFNGVENLSFGEKKPIAITGPGEYEISEIFIKGYLSKSGYGGGEKINTIYTMTFDNMNICFLGAINDTKLDSRTLEELDDIDILFVPIGENGVLNPSTAYKFAVGLSPKVIIPVHFDGVKSDNLKKFVKESGNEKFQAEDKLTVKKKDIDKMEAEVIVLKNSQE